MASLVVLTALSACWEAQEVEVMRVVPGVISLPGARTVAVGEISGPGGDSAGHLLAESLMQLRRFDVLDWSSPHGLGHSRGGWADNQGTWQTADAAFLGSLQEPQLVPSYQAESAFTQDGKEITTYSRTMTMRITGLIRVLDPHNGLIIGSSSVTGESTAPPQTYTVAGSANLPAVQGDTSQIAHLFPDVPYGIMQQLAVQALVAEVTDLVASVHVPTTVTLYHDKRNADLERALAGARRGQWHDALKAYATAVEEMEEHVPSQAYMAHYNYGVAMAFSGELARGIDEVRVALSQNKKKMMQQTLETLLRFHDESLQLQGGNQVRR